MSHAWLVFGGSSLSHVWLALDGSLGLFLVGQLPTRVKFGPRLACFWWVKFEPQLIHRKPSKSVPQKEELHAGHRLVPGLLSALSGSSEISPEPRFWGETSGEHEVKTLKTIKYQYFWRGGPDGTVKVVTADEII